MNEALVVPAKLNFSSIALALATGWRTLQRSLGISVLYAGMVGLLGLAIIWALLAAGFAPLVPFAAGAFMLVAPMLLAGFFGIAEAVEKGRSGSSKDLFTGFRQAPPAMLVLSLVCTLLFMVFTTDVAILYSYQVGGLPVRPQEMLRPAVSVWRFLLWGGISGGFLGFIAFTISAFSVPLMCEHRAGLVRAVTASVRGVFHNFPVAIGWAVLLTVATLLSVIVLPLLPFMLPLLAYASHALYRQAFPQQ